MKKRPRVVCHMMASLDGRIVTDGWPMSEAERGEYEAVHETYEPDAWLVGRVTMERHFADDVRPADAVAREHDGPPRYSTSARKRRPVGSRSRAWSDAPVTCSGCAIAYPGSSRAYPGRSNPAVSFRCP